MTQPDDIANGTVAWGILSYLHERPQAQDSARGISQWWLGDAQPLVEEVEQALGKLVAQEWMEELIGPNGRKSYRLKPGKREALDRLLNPSGTEK